MLYIIPIQELSNEHCITIALDFFRMTMALIQQQIGLYSQDIRDESIGLAVDIIGAHWLCAHYSLNIIRRIIKQATIIIRISQRICANIPPSPSVREWIIDEEKTAKEK